MQKIECLGKGGQEGKRGCHDTSVLSSKLVGLFLQESAKSKFIFHRLNSSICFILCFWLP